MQYLVKANFNPRAREGRDLGGVRSIATMRISIHAPVMGATRCFSQREALSLYFNPRAREGRDAMRLKFDNEHIIFQSTRP